MRKDGSRKSIAASDDEDDAPRLAKRPLWWRFVLRRPGDSVAGLVCAVAVGAVLVNALYRQPGPHPAPLMAARALPIAQSEATGAVTPRVVHSRPAEPDAPKREAAIAPAQPAAAPARSRLELITEIQKELAQHAFYDGVADGVYGSRTDSAIRDFEQAAGLKPSGNLNEDLLAAIRRSSVRGKAVQLASAAAPPRKDPIADLIAPPPKLVTAVQRALTQYGYAQLKVTGNYDAETRSAIRQFERDRKLPVTGEISERLTRELSAVTGRPLD